MPNIALSLCLAALLVACSAPTRHVHPLAVARPYLEKVPQRIDRTQRYPLLILLHGLGASGLGVRSYYGIDAVVEERQILVAFPNGTRAPQGEHWYNRNQSFWNATDICCDFKHTGVDDVSYLDAVIDDMAARYPVDTKRIYLAGISNGGYMAYRYACDRAERVAAIASQAGVMWSDIAKCRPKDQVAVLQVHGTADDFIPYNGGKVLGHGPVVISARESAMSWVKLNRCNPVSKPVDIPLDIISNEIPQVGAETTREKWDNCRGVELWTMHGGAHSPRLKHPEWPRELVSWLLLHRKP